MNRRTLSLLLIAGAVPLAAGACLPDGGSPPPPVLQEGPFSESEPNNTAAQADVLPAAASGFVVNGSQNDSDDPATGDTDVFQLAAVQDGTLTVTCISGVNTGTTLTVRNVTTGATGASGAPCTSASVDVHTGDVVRFSISDPVAVGNPFGLQVTYS